MSNATETVATLVRGSTYSLLNPDGSRTRFTRGVGVAVTDAQQAYLEANALDWVTARDPETDAPRGEHRQKFKFTSRAA